MTNRSAVYVGNDRVLLRAVEERGVAPDFVKIDAEGAESAILRGAAKLLASKRPLTMVLEFFPAHVQAVGDDPAAFLQRLADLGFRIRLIEDRRRKIVDATRATLLGRSYSEPVVSR